MMSGRDRRFPHQPDRETGVEAHRLGEAVFQKVAIVGVRREGLDAGRSRRRTRRSPENAPGTLPNRRPSRPIRSASCITPAPRSACAIRRGRILDRLLASKPPAESPGIVCQISTWSNTLRAVASTVFDRELVHFVGLHPLHEHAVRSSAGREPRDRTPACTARPRRRDTGSTAPTGSRRTSRRS